MGHVVEGHLKKSGSQQVGTLKVKSEPLPQNPMEMSFGGLSADQIAEMRARRILLNQPPPHVPGDSELAFLNRSLLDIFVSGTDGPLQVKESSIPKLFQRFSSNPDLFVTLAKLTSVMLLQLSHTVEQVLRLEMRLEGNVLHIVFAGRRARRYMNVDPHIMHLSGTLDLLKG
jgi:hypothetical protein